MIGIVHLGMKVLLRKSKLCIGGLGTSIIVSNGVHPLMRCSNVFHHHGTTMPCNMACVCMSLLVVLGLVSSCVCRMVYRSDLLLQ
jgi:hypothetical protein